MNKKRISSFTSIIKASRCFPGRSRFSEYMIEYNNLNERGFKEWVFYPGMLFNSKDKWWGDGGIRDKPHEGLDLCLYRDEDGKNHILDETINIPIMYEGKVAGIIDDFIGKSIYVSHDIYDGKGNRLYTIYGHTEPYDGITRGTVLDEGSIIATITDARKKKAKMSSHVHVSIAWLHDTFPHERLDWKTLSSPGIVTLWDPLEVITCNYTLLKYQ